MLSKLFSGRAWRARATEILAITANSLFSGLFAMIAVTSLTAMVFTDVNIWISAHFVSPRIWNAVLGTLSLVLAVGFGFPRAFSKPKFRLVTTGLIAGLALCCLYDTLIYYKLLYIGLIQASLPIPFSLVLMTAFLLAVYRLRRADWAAKNGLPAKIKVPYMTLVAGGGGCSALCALILCFGLTSYARQADCAIILGARVRADRQMTLVLQDRVDEGVRLFKAGHVQFLVMTGGTGSNGLNEAEVMAENAVKQGVPADQIMIDFDGNNTRLSAKNCADIMARANMKSAIIVSSYFHMARCKNTFRRAGIECVTVPARRSRFLRKEPFFVLREVAAYIKYSFTG